MTANDENLLNTLFNDFEINQESESIGIEIINSMYVFLDLDDICNYHDFTSYKTAIPKSCTDYLNVIHINARSIEQKL